WCCVESRRTACSSTLTSTASPPPPARRGPHLLRLHRMSCAPSAARPRRRTARSASRWAAGAPPRRWIRCSSDCPPSWPASAPSPCPPRGRPTSVPVRLVLFDIDGTLVLTKGAGRRALGAALLRVYGTSGLIDGYDFRGKTDPRIVTDLMGAAGLAPEVIHAGLGDCFEAYARGLTGEIGGGHCLP